MRILLFLLLISAASADLRVGFYNSTCPQAESIIKNVVRESFQADRTVTAAVLRLFFHDCFVTGCDASILIDSTKNTDAEKDAGINFGVRGYDLIDKTKKKLEERCPSAISCADVIALAARDSVALAGGPRYAVPTGRRDTRESRIDDANGLPPSTITVGESLRQFKAKGLTAEDMVVLLGGHTVGRANCGFFRDRLSGEQPDPAMDSNLRSKLSEICSSRDQPRNAALDQGTEFLVDNKFYQQIGKRRGVLKIDQALALDNSTASIVASLRKDNAVFLRKFADALVKLGRLGVLEGKQGEIRKICSVVN